jgi:hypothetical protein
VVTGGQERGEEMPVRQATRSKPRPVGRGKLVSFAAF